MRCLLLGSFLSLWCLANSLYFYVEEGRETCFLEDVEKDTLVVGQYRSATSNVTRGGVGVKIIVREPRVEEPLVEKIASSRGRFSFTAQTTGEHEVCFTTNATSWSLRNLKLRFDLDITIGEATLNYDEIAKKEHLSAIEVDIRKLQDDVRVLRRNILYMKSREAAMRHTTDSTNLRALLFSLFQVGLILAFAYWQVSHLQQYFKAKKFI
mmetsp:Transcript_14030/g.36063  ORF Transcript_14030/g.36063 Transcript_14030/m.36063 type:complete len:210 (+) Transcript_14030:280-909(+)